MDFDAAETFLKRMRAAHEGGDTATAIACRKMIMVALEIPEPYDPRRARKQDPVDARGAGTGR